jgi:hypothetical protein
LELLQFRTGLRKSSLNDVELMDGGCCWDHRFASAQGSCRRDKLADGLRDGPGEKRRRHEAE